MNVQTGAIPTTRAEGRKALDELRPFMGDHQRQIVSFCLRGEEGDWFAEVMARLAERVRTMPVEYGQRGKGDDAIVYLHYFSRSGDWYIMEKDSDPDGAGQVECFGLADIFQDGGELGYNNIAELIENGVELDFHFQPTTLGALREKRGR